jgi:hypothetical protein
MTARPTFGLVTAAARADANRVFVAMGRGEAFGVPAYDAPGKLLSVDPPTHYYFFDVTAEDHDVRAWEGMQSGDLPPVAPGVVWGEGGIISAADAMAAVTRDTTLFATKVGDLMTAMQFRDSILAGAGLYLPVPEA